MKLPRRWFGEVEERTDFRCAPEGRDEAEPRAAFVPPLPPTLPASLPSWDADDDGALAAADALALGADATAAALADDEADQLLGHRELDAHAALARRLPAAEPHHAQAPPDRSRQAILPAGPAGAQRY